MTENYYIEEKRKIESLPVEEQKKIYEGWIKNETNKNSSRVLLHLCYGSLLYENGEFQKTIELLEPLLLDYQSYPYCQYMVSCFNLMGVVTYCETEYSIARYYFEIALDIVLKNKVSLFYSFEYNNLALSYIAEKKYEETLKYIELGEKNLADSDEEMGSYLFVNKSITLQKIGRLEEALEAYNTAVDKYNAKKFIPFDTLRAGTTLFYKLGDFEKFEELKKQVLQEKKDMYAPDLIDVCMDLFECGMDSSDYDLVEELIEYMDSYMKRNPKEIKVGITVSNLKYEFATKIADKDAILIALEEKNKYNEMIIRFSEQKRLLALKESLSISKDLQEALISKEQAAIAKTQFLENMSHDIRTPINGIIGMLSIIRKNGANSEKAEDCINKIESSSKLLLSLVNDVLDMAKLTNDFVVLKQETFNIDTICRETGDSVGFQAEEAGIKVFEEHEDFSNLYVIGSPLHLKKVLINLFSNAIKYNKKNGGEIHTSMHILNRTEDDIIFEFKIRDTGIGMSEEFINDKLFKPFMQANDSSRTEYKGTGLGMAIVKQIVEKMNGTIKVESKIREGSSFTVVIPFKIDKTVKVAKQEEVEKKGSIEGMNFLVAEDNELNMEIIEFLLEENGAKLDKAENGIIALNKFKEAKEGTYNCILMDLMMPEMDGLTATKEIRKLEREDAKKIPIIAMTANAFQEDVDRCLQAGMNAHLAKPLDMKKVISTISKFCK